MSEDGADGQDEQHVQDVLAEGEVLPCEHEDELLLLCYGLDGVGLHDRTYPCDNHLKPDSGFQLECLWAFASIPVEQVLWLSELDPMEQPWVERSSLALLLVLSNLKEALELVVLVLVLVLMLEF